MTWVMAVKQCVAQVVDMIYMFDGAAAFNQDLNGWNVLRRYMSSMFCTDKEIVAMML
jgi:hypothetical protein